MTAARPTAIHAAAGEICVTKMELSQKLKQLRKKQGLAQLELAEKVVQVLSACECGENVRFNH